MELCLFNNIFWFVGQIMFWVEHISIVFIFLFFFLEQIIWYHHFYFKIKTFGSILFSCRERELVLHQINHLMQRFLNMDPIFLFCVSFFIMWMFRAKVSFFFCVCVCVALDNETISSKQGGCKEKPPQKEGVSYTIQLLVEK